jgi:radical SAM protein with 4Fe4S-binding SPASM domain
MKEREYSTQETAPYRLGPECWFVPGNKRAAIYDLNTGNIYSLNETARRIIEGSLSDSFGFWEKLKKLGVVEATNFPPRIMELEIPEVGLEFMWLELTKRCNQKCLHCYASAENLFQNEELPISEWEKIIEEGGKLGCKKLQFIGGEPLLFRGVFDLAKVAKDLNYEFIEIFTNGTLLDERKIQSIKDLGISIAISLYSTAPEIHDRITQIPGSFQRTFKTLQALKEAGVPTRIGLVIMKQNQDTILETQMTLQEMGFDFGKIDVVRPTGRGSCADLLPKEEVIQTWALMTKPDFSITREQFYHNLYWNSCWAGKIAITPDGKIIPCIFAREHIVWNARNGLEEGIQSKKLQKLWKITKDQIEGCQSCEYRYACHDCRPLAESTTGNLYAKDSRCTYNPITGEWKKSKKKGGEKSL